jgi:hypothetical protein
MKSVIRLGHAVAAAALVFGTAVWSRAAQVVPTFDATNSTATATHSPTLASGSDVQALTIQGASPVVTYNHLGSLPLGGDSRARAGIGHTETLTKATGVFAPGLGVTQNDPEGNDPVSQLRVDFTLKWNVFGSFGAPNTGAFSLTIGGTLGIGGTAEAVVEVHWNAIDGNGQVLTDIRSAYTQTLSFSNSTASSQNFSGTLSAPAAAFIPASLNSSLDGSIPAIFIVTGFVRLRVNNDAGPSDMGIQDVPQFIGMTNNPDVDLAGIPGLGVAAVVPAPSAAFAGSALGIGLLGLRVVRQRRRLATSH